MGIPRQFNDIIQKHLNVYAAWPPVTNSFELGDYGIISDGVFTSLGNIREFNVSITTGNGPEASIDFTSANSTVVKFAGGVQVDVIPAAAIDAKIKFSFADEKSFLVKVPSINSKEIKNVNQVAVKLRDTKGWDKKWKVVFQVYRAIDPLIVATKEAGTEITVSGDVNALRALRVGNASVEVGTNRELGVKIHGKEGVIGLGLFKLKVPGGGTIVLTEEERIAPAEIEILDKFSPEEEDL